MQSEAFARDFPEDGERVSMRRETEASGAGGNARRARTRPASYEDQLRLLADTYREIRAADLKALRLALRNIWRRQAVYVGSGGALAVAQLAADIHEAQTRMLARAATPLDLIAPPPLYDAAVMLFTSSGRHPDAAATVEAARRNSTRPISLVTHRQRQDLPAALAADDVDVVTLPSVVQKEGFLATNSVLAMASAIVVASGYRTPVGLPHVGGNGVRRLRENTLILDGPGLSCVGTDLETRLSETGLSSCQVTDYRNFAHGRHTGLARRLENTTIVALISPEVVDLATATLRTLPPEADVIRLETRMTWPVSALDLLVASMKLVAATAEGTDFDPSRPSVPAFGRRLYHLSSRRYLRAPAGAVDRKLVAGRVQATSKLLRLYEQGLQQWLTRIREVRFGGLVADYDGTACTTQGRFELPDEHVRGLLLGLLSGGAVVGFASGRGTSLHRDLRHWVPERYWSQIELGLYNGGLALSLADQLAASIETSPVIHEVGRRLRAIPIAASLRLEEREYQLSVVPHEDSGLSTDMIVGLIREVLAWPPTIDVKVVASGHSVDVIPPESAKTRTLERVSSRIENEVLAIGDQGQVGGNDFELLAATNWSLSVDRVSSDPTRCWNLDQRGESGPRLLARYLASLRPLRGGLAFRWKA